MLTDTDIFWQQQWHPFEHIEHDRNQYSVYAIIIDNEVVDVAAYKKSFIDLYNSHKFVERNFANGQYTIDILTENNNVIEQLNVSEKIGSIFLSDPITLLINDETSYATVGMKYINNTIVKV